MTGKCRNATRVEPTVNRILLSPPDVGELEQEYVLHAMRSGWVAPVGPDLDAFEQSVAERVGVRHGVGLSSGTAALHLALVHWRVGPGDVVPVSTFTFAATVNAIRYVGAEPHFIDCETSTGNMSPSLLKRAVQRLQAVGRHIPVIVPVDMLGKCVNYHELQSIANEAGARLLCDSAESFGANFQGRPAGSFGDASVLSFNGNKILTTSGGGMLLTNSDQVAAHVRKLSTQAREPVPHYEHTETGFNYRLSNILAALGRGQLVRFNEMLAKRRVWRDLYGDLVAGFDGVEILGGAADEEDNCWLTTVLISPLATGSTADELSAHLARLEIETRPVWKPMHLQPIFRQFDSTLDGSSENLFQIGLTLPSGSGMSAEQFGRVLDGIRAWWKSR